MLWGTQPVSSVADSQDKPSAEYHAPIFLPDGESHDARTHSLPWKTKQATTRQATQGLAFVASVQFVPSEEYHTSSMLLVTHPPITHIF
jgi:hypothetical protein